MSEEKKGKRAGCSHAVVILLMLVWLGAMPPGVAFLTRRALGEDVAPGVLSAVAVSITAVVLLLPFVVVALLTRRRPGWEVIASVASGLVATAGYLVLDAAMRAVLPEDSTLTSSLSILGVCALRLGVFVPYTALAAWLAPRLAGMSRYTVWEWLGLTRFDGPTVLLALAVAALVTVLWPVTGALGDSLTSLNIACQTLAWAIPQVLILWGLVFRLLTCTTRRWAAAMTTILLYGMSTFGYLLPAADWDALGAGVLLLPLAFLLAELRTRESGVYPLLVVTFCYCVAPLLFVDPRDVIANGIPELQHVVSHAFAGVVVVVAALALWGGRLLLLALRDRVEVPPWARQVAAMMAALVMWGAWAGVYVFAGEPGFANDGFLIILEEQAGLGAAYDIPDLEARRQYVYDALVETAQRTQAPLRAELDRLGVHYRPYYVVNMIRVDSHRGLMRRFADWPGVAQVIRNPNVREYPRHTPLPYGTDTAAPPEVQENLAAIHADEAWALGVMGEGIVVAGQDTGYDWTHPALKSHYRGWDGQRADHDYNWHDAWDDAVVPFDADAHGTHTMGTVLGDDGAGNRTGVAPGAQWIGCRNMRRGFGNPGAYAECMEFFLAPYPHGGDPFAEGEVRLAPHVINNSWGCPDFEGCFPDTLKPAVEALRAAGIMMVVSAGNDGPACATAIEVPANYNAVFSVGAVSNDGDIVGFSSRGPVDGLIKPDVTAPGAYVRSSVPGGEYRWAGGTSMAGPHVAGLVALLWSANPTLAGDVDATEALICQTALPKPVENVCTVADDVPEEPFGALIYNPVCACGDVTGVPNNVYGCGFIDAGSAVRAALGQ